MHRYVCDMYMIKRGAAEPPMLNVQQYREVNMRGSKILGLNNTKGSLT